MCDSNVNENLLKKLYKKRQLRAKEDNAFHYSFYSVILVSQKLEPFISRNLVGDVWSVLQENAIKYVSNTMFLPLIVRLVEM